jgi:hypothetical protein
MMKMEEIKNPYNKKTQEAEFLNWEAGYLAKSAEENPYLDSEDPEFKTYSRHWNKGFKANPEHNKKAPIIDESTTEASEVLPTSKNQPEAGFSTLDLIPTDLLETELKKRKLEELKQLQDEYAELGFKLKKVQLKIDKILVLTES